MCRYCLEMLALALLDLIPYFRVKDHRFGRKQAINLSSRCKALLILRR
uniref:Uncharacterized protein n=1 Tax=Picea glauca TaxID=3330 RepID=A0A117NH09_PICGL|nr:hypothetical protein ABT39_MTgene5773 [Picea glauca]